MSLDFFLPYINAQFYLLLATPVVLSTLFIWLQALLDRHWISADHVLNKFNHLGISILLFAGSYLGIKLLVFGVPLAELFSGKIVLWGGIIMAAQFFTLFLMDCIWDGQKYLNAFLVWLSSVSAWGYYWWLFR